MASRPIIAPIIASLIMPILFAPVYASEEEWHTHYAVNGFVNSGPPDPYQIFKIHYRVINGTIERFSMPYVEYAHYMQANATSQGNGTLEIMFPKNYPSNNYDGHGEAIFFLNEQEILPEFDENDCFYTFSVPFSGSAVIDVVWTDLLTGDPFHGLEVPERCLSDTIVQNVVATKDGIISPLHQLKAGVKPDEVVCAYGFELIMHPDNRPYCAMSRSVEQLYNRWNILPPPSPPAAQYPLLGNVTSFISTPFTIVQNQSTPVEFRIQNNNDFTLYDVKIHNFSTAHIPVSLRGTYTIEKLSPHETGLSLQV